MPNSDWIGKSIGGRYKIEALLGQGGMSAVYVAKDPNLRRRVAVKLIHPHLAEEEEFIHRFQEEASAIAQLRHRNIVQVHDFNQDGHDFYMVMEYVEGETLREKLDRLNDASRLMSFTEALKYAITVCDAADYAHQRNLIHRDIKPPNVMIDNDGQPILMDFGIAKIVGGPQYTATGATLGTALYMPPEQIRGETVDRRSDVYSISVMLYEMITGHPPFRAASPMTLLMMHISDPIPNVRHERSDSPPALNEAIEKAMAKEPADRFQSAAEMSAFLRRVLTQLEKSHQAKTDIGQASFPTSDAARANYQRESPDKAPSEVDGRAGYEATALPRSQVANADIPTVTPESTQPREYQPPKVVSSSGRNRKLFLGASLLVFLIAILAGGVLLTLTILNQAEDGNDSPIAIVESSEESVSPASETATFTAVPSPSPSVFVVETQSLEDSAAAVNNTPQPSPTPVPRRVGLMEFMDNNQARAGSLRLFISEASSPAESNHYELWLRDGQTLESFGSMDAAGGLNASVDSDVNLIARFDSAIITVEPDDLQSDTPTSEPMFIGTISLASLEHIRTLLANASESPEQMAYLVGAEEQTLLAVEHHGFMLDALLNEDLDTAKQHAEHVINILSGEENSGFGDWNGDGLAQNPGDGFGVISYLERAVEQARLAADAEGASEEVSIHARHTIISLNNSLEFVDESIETTGRILSADSIAEIQPSAELLGDVLQKVLDGIDVNGDGVIDPSPGEGGLLLAYEHALKMASFEVFLAEDVGS